MDREVRRLLEEQEALAGKTVRLKGWIRNHRRQKEVGFIDFFDGTAFASLQVVYTKQGTAEFTAVAALPVGASVEVEGVLMVNAGKPELQAKHLTLIGDCASDYPLQPKRHSLEFLREISHLRPRTRVFQAIYRVRSLATRLIHEYFQKRDYLCVQTPLLTANDAEGAGSTFSVCLEKNGSWDDMGFFGKRTSLAVTGQLEAELFAMAFRRVYSFGPAFRAENSNTRLHAAEFWMIEPELAFCKLPELMETEEIFFKSLVGSLLEQAEEELAFLESFSETPLRQKLEKLQHTPFARVTYTQAMELLQQSGKTFSFPAKYGEDLAREHERYLTEEYFHSPVFVYDWPKECKPFYMVQNEDEKTVGAVDLLVPGVGELMGGGEREADYEKLVNRMREMGVSEKELWWYLELRRFGSCPHAGFGMGFDRFLLYVTGMENIRDVCSLIRASGTLDF